MKRIQLQTYSPNFQRILKLLIWFKIFYPFLCKNFSFNWTCSLFRMSCNLLLNEPKFWFSASFKPLWFEWLGTSDNLAGSHTIVRDRWFEIPWFYFGFSNFTTSYRLYDIVYIIWLCQLTWLIGFEIRLIENCITMFHCEQNNHKKRLKLIRKQNFVLSYYHRL